MSLIMKQLHRSRHNRVIAGVFGGLGEYWGVDPVLLRLGFVLLTIFTHIVPGIITYAIAALVVPPHPEAKKDL